MAPPLGTMSEHVVEVVVPQPAHPMKLFPETGASVSVRLRPTLNKALHTVPGQVMPAGRLVTEPSVEGFRFTVTTACVVLPPGQVGRVRSLTVTVAKLVTKFPPLLKSA